MLRFTFGVAVSVLCPLALGAEELGLDHTAYRMAIPGGFAVTADLVHLVVSQPDTAELVFFDTVTEKETRRVEVEFAPGAMALKDKSLFVAGKGSAIIYELDFESAKVLKEFSVAGDGISRIAAHPKRPLLYASTGNLQVFSIDTRSGKATKTPATGDHLAVAPDGKAVFTGMQPRSPDGLLLITETPDGNVRFIYDRWGVRAAIAKYKVVGNTLAFAAAQNNAAVNGRMMHLTPDGKRVLMTGGGGWRPPAEGGTGGGYVTAIFNADKLESMVGQALSADAIVFHPVLTLAATNQGGRDITLIHGKSFKQRQKIVVAAGAGGGTELFAFVGKGTKLVLFNGANPENPREGLHFFDFDLSAEERKQVANVFGALPAPIAAVSKPASEPEPAARDKAPPRRNPTSGKAAKKEVGVASAGFNDEQGLNSDPKKSSPYPLDVLGLQAGVGEPGWNGFWTAADNITYQREVVQEGDGAMFIKGTINAVRVLAVPYRQRVRVEQQVLVPEGGDLKAYLDQVESSTSAMWFAANGKFTVLDGAQDQNAQQKAVETNFDCVPNQWYKVTVDLDFAKATWEFSVDDKKFDHAPLHFRGKPQYLQEIRYLSEKPEGVYIDALRVEARRQK